MQRIQRWFEAEVGDHGPYDRPSESFRFRVALVIAVVSVAGAVSAWRASAAYESAVDSDRHYIQQLVTRERLVAEMHGVVAQDLRLFARYQEIVKGWKLLAQDADAVRPESASLGHALDAEAREQRKAAQYLRRYFQVRAPRFGGQEGNVGYDDSYALQLLKANESELHELTIGKRREQSQRTHHKAVYLTAITVLFAIALFVLTIANLSRRHVRLPCALSGGAVAVVALSLLLAAEIAGVILI